MALIQFTKNHSDHSTDKGYQFEFFCDNWDLYTVGNTEVQMSQTQAIQIAKQAAIDKYSLSGNQTSPDFTILDQNAMATLSMQDRGNYTLYPHWEILLPLDKAYGAVTAIRVLVWADTGKVAYMAAVGNGGAPQGGQDSAAGSPSRMTPAGSNLTEQNNAIAGSLIAAAIAVSGYLLIKRRR